LLVLYAVHLALLVASEVWPMPGTAATIQGATIAAILTGVVGTIVAGMALAQALVVAYQATSNRAKKRISVAP
jgi:hypothetical protein